MTKKKTWLMANNLFSLQVLCVKCVFSIKKEHEFPSGFAKPFSFVRCCTVTVNDGQASQCSHFIITHDPRVRRETHFSIGNNNAKENVVKSEESLAVFVNMLWQKGGGQNCG